METRAWRTERFRHPAIPMMIGKEERRYLHWLGRTVWSGEGSVLEFGPWLGGSTACLAEGMRKAGPDPTGRLHTVDNFRWREFMAARAPLDLRPGDSFRAEFERFVEPWRDIVRAQEVSLPDDPVPGDGTAASYRGDGDAQDGFLWDADEPVEILFIDGAKSWRAMRALLRATAPSLIPGRSVLVSQDFKYWECYWVPMVLARFDLAPLHNVLKGTTVAFRVNESLSTSLLDELEDGVLEVDPARAELDLQRMVRLLEQDGDRSGAAHVALSRVGFLSHRAEPEAALSCLREVESRWPVRCGTAQLELARTYLKEEKGLDAPRRRALQWAQGARVLVRSLAAGVRTAGTVAAARRPDR